MALHVFALQQYSCCRVPLLTQLGLVASDRGGLRHGAMQRVATRRSADLARLTVSVPVAVPADPEADAGRVSGGRRPGQRGPALPGPRDLVRVVRAPGQADPVQVSDLGREKLT